MPDPLRDAFDADAFRELGHRVIDRLADHLGRAMRGETRVMPALTPEESRAASDGDVPRDADPARFEEVLGRAIDGATHLHHPRFVGHQVSAPLPASALAELASALLNNGMAVFEMGPAAVGMEVAVVKHLTRVFGLGDVADGVLTSGGSMGNLTAMLAMRRARAGFDVWAEGAFGGPALAVLASGEAHYSVKRAAHILGWGAGGVADVAVDGAYRMRPDALAAAKEKAEAQGRRVIGVVASACSTATGSFDPLEPVADFCAEHGLWLHVDAAHGGAAALSARYRELLRGVERADSVVFDAHKMMLVPALVTAVLFRDGDRAYDVFKQRSPYLFDDGDPRARWFDIGQRTLECTKRMMGFEVYATLQTLGTDAIDAYVTGTFDLARRFAAVIEEAPDLELATSPMANIVCFKHRPDGVTPGPELDRHQTRVRQRILASGRFYLVEANLGDRGQFLRTTLVNPLTTDQDLAALLHAVREAATEPFASPEPPASAG